MITYIFDYGMNGEGVAKVDGKILLLNHAIVGEQVEYEILENYKNYSIGNLKTIITKSSNRIDPPCPYFYKCGGCDLQHLNYPEQLKFKSDLIKKTLKKIAGIDIFVEPTIASDNCFNYRNKISFDYNNENIGFFKKNSKDIVKIDYCMLASKNINKILTLFKTFLQTNQVLAKQLKNLVIREISNQILVGVVAKKYIGLKDLYNLLSKNFDNIGLYLIINNRADSVVLSGKVLHIDGIKTITINNFDLTYSVDLIGFHQTNLNIQNKLYQQVLQYIPESSFVCNGFSGQGLLSAIICKKAKKVVGIEINPQSHKSAETLKHSNNLKSLTNICGDFFKEYDKIKDKVAFLILDPSKKGCGPHIMKEIIGAKNIIYISCNPIALAKDLREITKHYEIEQVIPYDMFPNTKNVETLVKLKLKEKL